MAKAKIDLDGKLLALGAKFKTLADNSEDSTQKQMFSEIAATMARWAVCDAQTALEQKEKPIILKCGRDTLALVRQGASEYIPSLWSLMVGQFK